MVLAHVVGLHRQQRVILVEDVDAKIPQGDREFLYERRDGEVVTSAFRVRHVHVGYRRRGLEDQPEAERGTEALQVTYGVDHRPDARLHGDG